MPSCRDGTVAKSNMVKEEGGAKRERKDVRRVDVEFEGFITARAQANTRMRTLASGTKLDSVAPVANRCGDPGAQGSWVAKIRFAGSRRRLGMSRPSS